MPGMQRALLSCHDKTGLAEFARSLVEMGTEIIGTSGTFAFLRDAGIKATGLTEYADVPELLGGRVKSLHPKVHAGLLGVRDNKLHVEQMQALEWPWIDLLALNLPPLPDLLRRDSPPPDEMVDLIDIGGAAMLRSAAKNFRYVTVVVNPRWYPRIMHELRAHAGETLYDTRLRLAAEAFECTASYDAAIAACLKRIEPRSE